MEWFDLYDKNRQPLNRIHERGIPIPKGSYHVVVFVWIVNSLGELLLTKRSPEKPTYPNTWAITGGSVIAGETSLEAISREVFEETGIQADPEEFRYLDTFRKENSFTDTYLLLKDVALDCLVMQQGETCDARWVGRMELEKLMAEGLVAPPDIRRYQQLQSFLKDFIK